jgi:hypothetical protein
LNDVRTDNINISIISLADITFYNANKITITEEMYKEK